MYDFLTGVVTAGFLIAALFFFRFWKTTRDWFFAVLGIAFMLFAANQLAVIVIGVEREEHSLTYLLRLFGFALLLAAIAVKNLPRSKPRG